MYKRRDTRVRTALQQRAGTEVKSMRGWVKRVRQGSKDMFLDVGDGSCVANIQIVVPKSLVTGNAGATVYTGSYVAIEGVIQLGPKQTVELLATSFELIGAVATPTTYLPAQRSTKLDNFRQKAQHLRAQNSSFGARFRIRSELNAHRARVLQGRG